MVFDLIGGGLDGSGGGVVSTADIVSVGIVGEEVSSEVCNDAGGGEEGFGGKVDDR